MGASKKSKIYLKPYKKKQKIKGTHGDIKILPKNMRPRGITLTFLGL